MNQIANRQQSQVIEFKAMLRNVMQRDFPLPDNVKPAAFANAAIVAVQDNPKILQCDTSSVFRALRRLASLGLVPDGREAALVPFKTRVDGAYIDACQAMPMVFGLIKSARRSGTVADIRAHIVYQNEVDQGAFRYIVGDDESLEHTPILFGDRGPPVGAYAIAKLTDGMLIREVMTADEIDRVRRAGASQLVYEKEKRAQVSETPLGVWAAWPEEMWKKTVIRRLTKRLDLSAEDRRIINADEDAPMRDVTPDCPKPEAKIAPRGTAAALAAMVDEAPDPEDEPPAEDGEIMEPESEAEGATQAEAPEESEPHVETVDAMADARARGLEAHRIGMALRAIPDDIAESADLAKVWQAAWREADAVKKG